MFLYRIVGSELSGGELSKFVNLALKLYFSDTLRLQNTTEKEPNTTLQCQKKGFLVQMSKNTKKIELLQSAPAGRACRNGLLVC